MGPVDVFYIHYPTHKEQRLEYLERAKRIAMAARSVAKKFDSFINVELDVQVAMGLDNDDDDLFPYHYSRELKAHFWEEIKPRINLMRN